MRREDFGGAFTAKSTLTMILFLPLSKSRLEVNYITMLVNILHTLNDNELMIATYPR